jgi:hypothetical protein
MKPGGLGLIVALADSAYLNRIGCRRPKNRSLIAPERQTPQKVVPTNAELHSAKRRVPRRFSVGSLRTTSPGRPHIWLRRAPAHLVPQPGIGLASQLRRQVQMDHRFRYHCPSRRCDRRARLPSFPIPQIHDRLREQYQRCMKNYPGKTCKIESGICIKTC